MKNFANIDNAVGSFPDVTATDASGPGETDSFALVADYFNQHLGWMQALLNDRGQTPDGNNESDSAGSQILDSLRMLTNRKIIIPLTHGLSTSDNTSKLPNWYLVNGAAANRFNSAGDNAIIRFSLDLPVDLTIDLTITVRVKPGDTRTGSDRVGVTFRYSEYDDTSATDIESEVLDNGTTDSQDIVVTSNSLTVLSNRDYFIEIESGDDGATNVDYINGVKVEYSLS